MSWLLRAAGPVLGRAPQTLRLGNPIRSGQALKVQRIFSEQDQASWVAKNIHPQLTREVHAYQHVLKGKAWAPALLGILKDPQGTRWLLLEDVGRPLTPQSALDHLDALATLLATIHREGRTSWWPPVPWPKPVYVRHGYRFLRGELRIALDRLSQCAAREYVQREILPSPRESRKLLDRAWDALCLCDRSFLHGDINPSNVLCDSSGALRTVDYSQWGEGRWLWDLACLSAGFPVESRRHLLQRYLEMSQEPKQSSRIQSWEEALEAVLVVRLLITWGAQGYHLCEGTGPNRVEEIFQASTQRWENLRNS